MSSGVTLDVGSRLGGFGGVGLGPSQGLPHGVVSRARGWVLLQCFIGFWLRVCFEVRFGVWAPGLGPKPRFKRLLDDLSSLNFGRIISVGLRCGLLN